MAKKYQFTEEEKQQVAQAVKELETVSCGEIVPYFVSTSDDYSEASWYSSTLLTAFTALSIGILSYFWMLPFRLTPFEVSLIMFGALVVGFLIPILFPSTRRWIVSKRDQEARVNQRAIQAFLNEGVFKTQEHVGILIFVSRLEHMVVVLGDEGINEKVAHEDWQQVVNTIIGGIKGRKIGEGLVKAIGQCRDLLLKHGFVRKSTDFNELDDELRIED